MTHQKAGLMEDKEILLGFYHETNPGNDKRVRDVVDGTPGGMAL